MFTPEDNSVPTGIIFSNHSLVNGTIPSPTKKVCYNSEFYGCVYQFTGYLRLEAVTCYRIVCTSSTLITYS